MRHSSDFTQYLMHALCTRSVKSQIKVAMTIVLARRDVPVGVPLDLYTPTGMSCIGACGENCKSNNVSKYCVLLVAFLLL